MAMNKMGNKNNVKAPIKKATIIKPRATAKGKVMPKSASKMGLKGSC